MTRPSATVELLTASVRTLMVGNRQVTLSVYRQLDWVHSWEIEPFGRVNSDDGIPMSRLKAVIGRKKGTGELVRTQVELNRVKVVKLRDPFEDYDTPYEDWSELPLIVLAGLR